jgi:hypothetical protein
VIPAEARTPALRCARITAVRQEAETTACLLADSGRVLVSHYVGGFLAPGDEVEFSPSVGPSTMTELCISRPNRSRPKHLYLAPIGYVTQPKHDKRQECFLRAEVVGGSLGTRAINLPAAAVRDYFYRADRTRDWSDSPTLYDLLRAALSASPGELRLAYRVRRLELEIERAPTLRIRDVERAFNLLMQPQIRSCYDALLRDPDAPVLFPYGGFGALLVAGELTRDRQTFFAQRILSFLPDRRQRRFRAPFRRIDFLHDHAVYRDSRRKIEIILDPVILPLAWDPTWNQWKHLLGAKMGIEGTFVASGKYRLRSNQWELVSWLTALPSRLRLTPPADIRDQVQTAKGAYHRFGQYFTALEPIRRRLEHEPLERQELDRLCGALGIPGDFDVAQISWKPDYDPFFYNQLRKRARKMYLYRAEYIMELEHAIVVEVPELGHATYVFAKLNDIDAFVRLYAKTTKDDIRKNRDGIAERLGFLRRVTHGANGRSWVRELRSRTGETADYVAALE